MQPPEMEALFRICSYLANPPGQKLFPGLAHIKARRSPDILRQLLAYQRVECAVCGRPRPQNLDHDHQSGLARGLVCISCNRMLGNLSRTTLNREEGWRVGRSDAHTPRWYPPAETLREWERRSFAKKMHTRRS